MSLKHTFGIGFAFALALSGCGSSVSSSTQSITMGQIANSGQSGTAVLVDTGDGNVSVTLATSGGSDTGSQPAHIHTGVCGSGGPIFKALTNVSSGASLTTFAGTLGSLTGGTKYINIHKSSDASIILACGQIQ